MCLDTGLPIPTVEVYSADLRESAMQWKGFRRGSAG